MRLLLTSAMLMVAGVALGQDGTTVIRLTTHWHAEQLRSPASEEYPDGEQLRSASVILHWKVYQWQGATLKKWHLGTTTTQSIMVSTENHESPLTPAGNLAGFQPTQSAYWVCEWSRSFEEIKPTIHSVPSGTSTYKVSGYCWDWLEYDPVIDQLENGNQGMYLFVAP